MYSTSTSIDVISETYLSRPFPKSRYNKCVEIEKDVFGASHDYETLLT